MERSLDCGIFWGFQRHWPNPILLLGLICLPSPPVLQESFLNNEQQDQVSHSECPVILQLLKDMKHRTM